MNTPARAVDEAYAAALKIKQIEDEHFGGRPIAPGQHSQSVFNFFQAELNKQLKTVRMRLTEFKFCQQFINANLSGTGKSAPDRPPTTRRLSSTERESDLYTLDTSAEAINGKNRTLTLLDKLNFIDAVLNRYQAINPVDTPAAGQSAKSRTARTIIAAPPGEEPINSPPSDTSYSDSLDEEQYFSSDLMGDNRLEGGGFIPRSILRTADRFRRELDTDPSTEEAMIQDFRMAKARTRIAIRFLLLLIIIPLLTQLLTKTFVVGPLVDRFQLAGQIEQVINVDIEERFLQEMSQFEERLRFQNLISAAPALTAEQIEAQLKDKAQELAKQYKWALQEPLKNILADGLAVGAFAGLLIYGKSQIAVLKSFMDDTIYGLSDSAKAFIIILFTDVFVGFHSPHGWTVIVHNTLQHFGLPRNEDFIDMFIATFPVMLDAVFKYWVFRYLNQISPSAVATYRNMNE